MKIVNKHNAFYILLAILSWNCRKFVDVGLPKTELVKTSVFSNPESANSAVIGLYSNMNSSLESLSFGGAGLYLGLSADELINASSGSGYDNFSQNNLLSNTSSVEDIWSAAYSNIYIANAIIEGLSESPDIKESFKIQFVAEAKFVRAFFYFYLVNLFGDVPLELYTDFRTNAILPRTTADQVYQQIKSDLLVAQENLPSEYLSSTNNPTTERIRPTKKAATALLARINLYQREWSNAEAAATSIIDNSIFELEGSTQTVFKKDSKEMIWQIMPVINPLNSAEALLYVPWSSDEMPPFVITQSLLAAFEPGDKRKTNWLGMNTVNSAIFYYPSKFTLKFGWPPGEYNVILRLAEQYLIRAEARAQQGKIAEATQDLNTIRHRAGIPDTSFTDKNTLLLAIEKERQTELFAEWGHRWLDLKRTGRVDAVLSFLKGSHWQASDALYPIPFDQITLNSNLVQNPGY